MGFAKKRMLKEKAFDALEDVKAILFEDKRLCKSKLIMEILQQEDTAL